MGEQNGSKICFIQCFFLQGQSTNCSSDDVFHVGVVEATFSPEGDLLLHLGDVGKPELVLVHRVQHPPEHTRRCRAQHQCTHSSHTYRTTFDSSTTYFMLILRFRTRLMKRLYSNIKCHEKAKLHQNYLQNYDWDFSRPYSSIFKIQKRSIQFYLKLSVSVIPVNYASKTDRCKEVNLVRKASGAFSKRTEHKLHPKLFLIAVKR